MLLGCPEGEPDDLKITICNQTNESIFFYSSREDISEFLTDCRVLSEFELLENKCFSYYTGSEYYSNYRYTLYIFNKSTVDKYTCEEIRENELYDKKYLLSLEDLRELNFIINYTGD